MIRVVDSASLALLCGVFVLFLRSSDSDTVYEFSDVKYFHYDRNVDDPYGNAAYYMRWNNRCHAKMGFLPFATRVAPDKAAYRHTGFKS
ncbi:hypothetical protein DPMN_009589 [Dreissena polymorpha]|uniref:Uncharacterized protein n=1 Tax=Dreissena polymorpha TaxID=45954 RepID=A0A9D4N1H8_DREPO|nr:hypothetical protein DPMN_009589 [Dreissena polymorpha]